MARNEKTLVSTYTTNGLHRAVSDISFQLNKEALDTTLPPISEVEDAKCECCGLSEECTPEYARRVRNKFSGKWICGLCAEAVKEEVNKMGGGEEEGLCAHMSACKRFNRIARVYPVQHQANAMREILKKNFRAKFNSPKDRGNVKKGGIMRTSSCMSAITKEVNDRMTLN